MLVCRLALKLWYAVLISAWILAADSALAQPSAPAPIQGAWSLNQPGTVSVAPAAPRTQPPPGSTLPGEAGETLFAGRGAAQESPSLPHDSRPFAGNSTEAGKPQAWDQSEPVTESEAGASNPDSEAGLGKPNPQLSEDPFVSNLARGAESLGATRLSGSFIQTALLLGALGLAPAILLMTTCYIRIMVVLGLLRQALGTTQLPPTQVLMSLSIFLTILVMTPVWLEIKTQAYDPWSREKDPISWEAAWNAGIQPLKRFMSRQIEISGNRSAVDVLYRHGRVGSAALAPEQLADAPLNVILPAFILSELKVAFLLGFQIFLPFLILDLVVSTVTVSMGLAMLPPTMVSLPLKLILFVMVDGWNLVVGMLLQSFGGG